MNQSHNEFLILTAVDCGTLTNPSSGYIVHIAGTTFGQTVTYTCNAGYNLVGGSTRTCQATGVWSGSEPTCERMLLPTCMCAIKCTDPTTQKIYTKSCMSKLHGVIH